MMEITEKHVTESQLDQMVKLFENPEAMMRINREDVESVLVGNEGVLYEANNEEGEDNSVFMKGFFDELAGKEKIKTCANLLISINMPSDSFFLMDDMTVIHNFFYSLENEDVVAKWGLKSDAEGCMKLLALCTHPTSKKDV